MYLKSQRMVCRTQLDRVSWGLQEGRVCFVTAVSLHIEGYWVIANQYIFVEFIQLMKRFPSDSGTQASALGLFVSPGATSGIKTSTPGRCLMCPCYDLKVPNALEFGRTFHG